MVRCDVISEAAADNRATPLTETSFQLHEYNGLTKGAHVAVFFFNCMVPNQTAGAAGAQVHVDLLEEGTSSHIRSLREVATHVQ